jgi:hypothetical protein
MLETERLPSELVVQAAIRHWQGQGGNATIVHRGDAWGGAILIKLNLMDRTFQLLTQTRDSNGKLAWLRVKSGERFPESDADSYIERQLKRDPDLWVVEIEDRAGCHPFEGKIL